MTNAVQDFKKLLAPGGLPELGPGPRANVLSGDAVEEALHKLFATHKLRPSTRELVRSLILLWHDHQDAAHVIAQEIENEDGSFIHGIVHRREPDYSNAAYWFRRVGDHPCFPVIAQRVEDFLQTSKQPALQSKLISDGKWSATAFINECKHAAQLTPDDPQVQRLRQIQAIESEVLLEFFLKHAS